MELARLGGLLLCLALAAPASAATFVVNGTADTTDGACDPAPGGCTLREAIEAAVATPGRDTIRFDASAFPHGPAPVPIPLASALPVIADPAGTVIDGSGASVRITGSPSIADGLVFASAPGVPLAGVTVANVSLDRFQGNGVEICGGVPPQCDGDVTGALVQHVFVNGTGRSGIAVIGGVVKKAQVVDSVTSRTDQFGIAFIASSLVGARVTGCTASRSRLDAIFLDASEQRGCVVVDSFGLSSSEGQGIGVFAADGVAKLKMANVVAFDVATNGIGIQAAGVVAPKLSDVVASGASVSGVEMTAQETTAPVVEKLVADANGFFGVSLDGPVTGGEISQAHVYRHDGAGIAAAGADGLRLSRIASAENADGIFLAGSNSTIEGVHASHNIVGIEVSAGDGNTITKNASTGNEASGRGIVIDADSHANVIDQNVALGNDPDLFDANPACDANVWSDNSFGTRNEPCIH